MRDAHAAAMDESRRSPWPAAFAWCFLLFSGAAIAYGFWTINAAGEPLARVDVGPGAEALATTPSAPPPPSIPTGRRGRRTVLAGPEAAPCREFGPLWLDPSMNPVRVDLEAVAALIGTVRQPYEIALADPAGGVLWEHRGTLVEGPAEATSIRRTTRLEEFAVRIAGPHRFVVLLPEGSQDDVRQVTLAVRTHVVSADARILASLIALALASLGGQLLASRRRTARIDMPEEVEYREAA